MFLVGNALSPLIQNKFGMHAAISLGSYLILIGGISMLLAKNLFGLTALAVVLPDAISIFGAGLLSGPAMAGAVKSYKHIAGIASAAYGAIFLGGGSLLVAAIMQIEIVDASVLAINLCVMGAINIVVLRRLLRRRRH